MHFKFLNSEYTIHCNYRPNSKTRKVANVSIYAKNYFKIGYSYREFLPTLLYTF